MGAGITFGVTLNDMELMGGLAALADMGRSDALAPAWDAVGAAMIDKTRARFGGAFGPDGSPWKPSKRFLKDGAPVTLTKRGYLRDSVTSNRLPNGVEWGTNWPYAAIHQKGGTIDIAARNQTIYRTYNAKTDELGTRFVKKNKSTFASDHAVGAHKIVMPARPFLGIDEDDKREAGGHLKSHLIRIFIDGAAKGRSTVQ